MLRLQKLTVVLLMIVLGLGMVGCAEKELVIENPDVRGVVWGLTQEQVKKLEEAELVSEDEEVLIYDAEEFDLATNLMYYFDEDGKLNEVIYIFKEHEMMNEDVPGDFYTALGRLEHIYGEKDTWDWCHIIDNDGYGADEADKALLWGDVEFYTYWETRREEISLSVQIGKGNFLYLFLRYESKV